MDNFKHLCSKAFKSEIMDFDELSEEEQKALCKAYFGEGDGEDMADFIASSLFPNSGYLPDNYFYYELKKKANKAIDAFNLEIALINEVGYGPDLSCEFSSRQAPYGNKVLI